MAPSIRRLPFVVVDILLLVVVLCVSPSAEAGMVALAQRIPTAALRRLYYISNYGRLQLNNGLALTPQMGLYGHIARKVKQLEFLRLQYQRDGHPRDRINCYLIQRLFFLASKLLRIMSWKGLKLGIYSDAGYPPMSDTLNSTGHQIFYSLCEWCQDDPVLWAAKSETVGVQQMTYKIHGKDPDMLDVGNGGMTFAEYCAHFSIWALMKAPLLIGCDVRNMTSETKEILSNKEVIQVNQDPLGVIGRKVLGQGKYGCHEVWSGPLSGNHLAVALWNRCSEMVNITMKLPAVGLDKPSAFSVRDL